MKNKTILLWAVIVLLICLSLYFVIAQRKSSEFVKESSLNKTEEAPKEACIKKRKLIKAPKDEHPEIKEKIIHSDFAQEGYRDTSERSNIGHAGDSHKVYPPGMEIEALGPGPGGENDLEGSTSDYTGPSAYVPGMEIEPPGPAPGFENELIEAPESSSAEYIGDDGPEIYSPGMLIEPPGPGPRGENEFIE